MPASRKPGVPAYEITNVMILDRANVHHQPDENTLYRFNQRDLLALVREMIACAAGMPYPGPNASPFHMSLPAQRPILTAQRKAARLATLSINSH